MKNVNLVADKLHNKGFMTKVISSNSVGVGLSTRKPSKMEIETALDEIFDGIEFEVVSINNAVLVMWS